MNRSEINKLPIWNDVIPSVNSYETPVPTDVPAPKHLTKGYGIGNLLLFGSVWVKYTGAGHQGPSKQALDFLVPDGTIVTAAADGVVKQVVEHNTEYGNDESMLPKANMLVVSHSNGEASLYAHLAQESISGSGVAVGSTVEQGQPIAVVGKTGWMEEDQDHIHFEVVGADRRPENPLGYSSRKPRFTIEPMRFDVTDL